jgi:hypothetical protein
MVAATTTSDRTARIFAAQRTKILWSSSAVFFSKPVEAFCGKGKEISEMAIHWHVKFRSLRDETLYTVNVYDDSYTGSPVQLTGAANPFET